MKEHIFENPVDVIGSYGVELYDWLDYDPDYEVIDHLTKGTENKIWASFLFSSFDSIATASVILQEFDELPRTKKGIQDLNKWFSENASSLYVGKERKRLKYAFPKMLDSYLNWLGDVSQTEMMNTFTKYQNESNNYDVLDEEIAKIKYMGTLTKYDFMELIQRKCDYPILPTHMDTIASGCLGPVKAMKMVLKMTDESTDIDNKELAEKAIKFTDEIQKTYKHMDYALIETTLCKFQKLVGGRYYTGAEIDEMLGEIYHLKNKGYNMDNILKARQKTFHPDTLTENQVYDEKFLISLKKYGGENFAPITPFNNFYRGIGKERILDSIF